MPCLILEDVDATGALTAQDMEALKELADTPYAVVASSRAESQTKWGTLGSSANVLDLGCFAEDDVRECVRMSPALAGLAQDDLEAIVTSISATSTTGEISPQTAYTLLRSVVP
jgi:hypothetical protein